MSQLELMVSVSRKVRDELIGTALGRAMIRRCGQGLEMHRLYVEDCKNKLIG